MAVVSLSSRLLIKQKVLSIWLSQRPGKLLLHAGFVILEKRQVIHDAVNATKIRVVWQGFCQGRFGFVQTAQSQVDAYEIGVASSHRFYAQSFPRFRSRFLVLS